MLKLMKYEFRKLRPVLLVMLGALVALELTFIIGYKMEKPDMYAIAVVLISVLVFAVYGYILVSGITSYSRELTNRTGYLVFMTPTRPIGIVLSKLIFTLLAGIAATAVFGIAAYIDYAFLFERLDITPGVIDQIRQQANWAIIAVFGDITMNVDRLGLTIAYGAASVLIQVMYTMCTAYLAITLSATLLSNKKGFIRALASLGLFFALEWGAGKLNQLIINAMPRVYTLSALMNLLAASLGFYVVVSALFAWASASLLKHRVSL